MEPRSSLQYSLVPATCPYPEPTPSSPQKPLPFPEGLYFTLQIRTQVLELYQ